MAFLEIDGDARANGLVDKYYSLVEKKETPGTGIILLSLRGIITEAPVQDDTAAVVTVRTAGASPASLGTLTFITADPVGTIIDGSIATFWGEHSSQADISTYCVPAGYGIEAALTTAGVDGTPGDTTGKMLVVVQYVVIPRRIGEV